MSYWDKVLQRRISRRRGIAVLGAGSAAAAFLAACGGDDDDGGGTGTATTGGTGATSATGGGATGATGSSGLISEIVDTTDSAQPGRRLQTATNSEPNHFDGGIQGQGSLNQFNALAYSGLVTNKPGYKESSSYTEVVPDLAESWEFSPDNLQITFRLRQGVKFANTAPVSGREFDAEDVVATFNRYSEVGGNRAANITSVNPGAPLVSVEATDKYTVVYTLSRPSSFIMQRIANLVTGELGTIFPREVDESFDPRVDQIGTGGYIRTSYEPSVGIKYDKRPEYHLAPEPYMDGIDFAIVPEYTALLAQFKAGNILNLLVSPQDIVGTKTEEPRINLYSDLAASINPLPMMRFGWLPIDGQPSPFLDKRVRLAMSMSQDRDAFIDAFGNVSEFESAGLPVETYYFTSQGYVPGLTLDPRDAANFGENAKYLTYNPEESRALLDAAYPDGVPAMTVNFNTIGFFGATHADQVQVLTTMANDVGFNLSSNGIDYNLEYLPDFVTEQGNHEGIVFAWGASTSSDPIDYYVWRFWSQSGPTSGSLGFGGPDGSLGDQSGDPEVDAMIERGMAETDAEARVEIIQELQRYLVGQQYGVMRPGIGSGFSLAWPGIANFLVYQGDSRGAQNNYYNWWLDETKAPFV